MKSLFIIIGSLFIFFCADAQSISGSGSANVNDVKTYSYNRGSTLGAVTWTASKGTVQSTSSSGTTYSVTVKWTQAGTGTLDLTFFGSPSQWPSSKSVSIAEVVPTPSAPTVQSSNCGNSVLARGTPPSGVTWYWQGSNSNGTSTLSSSSTQTVSSDGTYYLRAYKNGTWSNASSSVYANVKEKPSTPSSPSTTKNCGNTVLTRGNPPSGITWYWQTSSGGTSTSNSSSTYTRTSNGTVYLRARNNSTGCWSNARSVSVSVNGIPSKPGTPTTTKNCGNTVLARGNPPSGFTWYWQTSSGGTSTGNSSATYTRTSNGTVYLRARNNSTGCWSSARTVSVSVNSVPSRPSTPTTTKNCGNTVLTRSNPPTGITWYWQTSSGGTSTSNSSATYTRTSNGTVYLRARNNTTGCWSSSRSVSVAINSVPSQPFTPSTTKNCGNTVLTRGNPPSGFTWYWQTSSGGTSTSNSSSTYTRTSNGTVYLRARNNSTGCWSSSRSVSVTVNTIPSTPSTPSTTKNCGNTVLTRSNPPSGITWYWQTSSGGTSTSNSSSTYTRTSNGTVYLRARNNSTGCWSSARSVSVSVNSVPSKPSTPTTTKNCGNTVLTRGNPPSGFTWYWQTSSGGTSTSNSSSTYTRTSNGTVHLKARNNTTGCWSSARSVSVTVNSVPSKPSTPTTTKNCGNTVLTRGNPPSGFTWYWQTSSGGTSTGNSSATYTRTSNGTVHLRARNNTTGCWSSARSVSVTVNSVPSQPSTPTTTKNCGNTVLTRGNPPTGFTWYWQTSSSGTSTGNSSSTYTRTSNGTVYLRARNNLTGCWSGARSVSVTVNSVPSQPSTPTTTKNCGNTVLTRGNPPSGFTWYWQTSSGGTSTSNSSATYTRTSNGTVYLRARNNTTGCWSSARSTSVTVNGIPSQPSTPTITQNCGNTVLTRSNPISGITYYWQTSSGGTSTSNSSTTYTRTSNGTVYLRARNNSTGCWSSARSVSVTVNSIPSQPITPTSTKNCGNTVLTRGTPPTGITWYWQTTSGGTSTGNTSSTYTRTSNGTVYLRARNNSTGCWGSARLVSVTVNTVPSQPDTPTSTNNCGNTVLTRGNPPSGITWYWQTTSGGTSTGNSSATYTRTSNGTVYLRARNNSTSCWSSSRAVSVTVNDVPEQPSVTLGAWASCQQVATLNAPDGETWYRQTSAGAESDSNPALATESLPEGTYHLRSKSGECWSPAYTFTINGFTQSVDPGLVLNGSCGYSGIERTAVLPGITWYWQGTNDSGTSEADSDALLQVNMPGTYYIRPKNTATGCWGDSFSMVVGSIADKPETPNVIIPTDPNYCEQATFAATAAPSGETYYWQTSASGTDETHGGDIFTTTTSGTYYARARNDASQCWSDPTAAIEVVIHERDAGTLTGNRIEFGSASGTLTLQNFTGAVQRWESSADRTTWQNIVNANPTHNYNVSQSTYFRAVVEGAPCSEIASNDVFIEILEPPMLEALGSTTLRVGQSLKLRATAGHSDYAWFRDGISISSGASNELVVVRPGTYHVMVTSVEGAIGNTNDLEVTIPDYNQNMIVTYAPRESVSDQNFDVQDYAYEQLSVSASTYDGLGRPSQQVALYASPGGNDIVIPFTYDALGRQAKSFLPYEDVNLHQLQKDSALAKQATYYIDRFSTTSSFSETRFEESPLNRPLEQGAPGDAWQLGGATVSIDYAIESAGEVIKWDADSILTDSRTAYDAGELFKNTTTDEDGNPTVEYTNKQGQVILKKSRVDPSTWAETYYIYDRFGNLSVVVPPEATARLDAAFFGMPADARTDFLNTWAFIYNYDGRNRMSMKKVPGADSVFMVYDRWDRLVLTQDGNQRLNNMWLFTKYDRLNRPIMTGTASLSGSTEEVRYAVAISTVRAETFTGTGLTQYSSDAYPTEMGVNEYLTVTYYDDYSFQSHADWTASQLAFTNPEGLIHSTSVRGQVTGTLTKAGSGFIKSVNYYDDQYRVIQAQSTNHLGGKDVATNYYNFVGQVTKSVSSHHNGVTTTDITRRFEYDHTGRLLKTWHQVNDGEEILIADNTYDPLGQLVKKELHREVGIDFEFNLSKMSSYGVEQDITPTTWSLLDERTLKLGEGNTWKKFDFSYNVTEETVLEFEFKSTMKGEIQGIGFENNNSISSSYMFRLYGTQNWCIGDFSYNGSGDWQKVRIPVGQYYTGAMNYLAFINDHDGGTKDGNSYFRNIRVFEDGDKAYDAIDAQQSLDYTYNIRGWLESINSSDLSSSADGDLFGMELLYNTKDAALSNSQLFNGNISAMKWSDPTGSGANNSRAYTYSYDQLSRLKTANHFQNTISTPKYGVKGLSYDLNGNIESLQRRGKSPTAYMDDLSYTYQGNQLLRVSDAATDTTGFHDGNTTGDDYRYDANGNMIQDLNKGITVIKYNHLNLPIAVIFSTEEGAQDSIQYLYDAAGIKLQQVVYDGGSLVRKTDYVGAFIYENDRLQLIQHQEGRTIPLESNHPEFIAGVKEYDYQYHLKDHLGNVRLTFSTTPLSYTMVETFETGEENGWQDLHRSTNVNANTTSGGNEVELLQSGQTGAMLFLSLDKGDTIDLSVNANYENAPSGNALAQTAYATLFGAFDGSSFGTGEGSSAVENQFSEALAGPHMGGKSENSTSPRAFLNYIVFDAEMNYVTAGFKQISTAAHGIGVHELVQLDQPYIADREGYILTYLSNENQEAVNVHFDDFTVYHGKTNVVSTQDYYPFGLTFNESQRIPSRRNLMNTFQDQEYEKETGWVKFKWRNHQPDIGRFFNIDPLAEDYLYNSPYAFSENKVVAHVELEGLESVSIQAVSNTSNSTEGTKHGNGTRTSFVVDVDGNINVTEGKEKNVSVTNLKSTTDQDNGITTTSMLVSGVAGQNKNESKFSVSLVIITKDKWSLSEDQQTVTNGIVSATANLTTGELTDMASVTISGASLEKQDGESIEVVKVEGPAAHRKNNKATRFVWRDTNGRQSKQDKPFEGDTNLKPNVGYSNPMVEGIKED